MAIKKNTFENYIKERVIKKPEKQSEKSSKYTHHRVFDELEKNGSQTVHKPNTNGLQTVHKPNTKSAERFTNGSRTVHKPNTQPNTNGSQKTVKNESISRFSDLSGLQRNIILTLYESAQSEGRGVTEKITITHLSDLINCNKNSIKTSIFRLKEKKCISIFEYKDGRGGWVKYTIEQGLYQEISAYYKAREKFTNGSQTVHKRFTQPNTTEHSSSNIYNITTTDSEIENKNKLPTDWQTISILPLTEINFTINQLRQLYQIGCTSPEVVQLSINHFAYGLAHNEKVKSYTQPLNVLMGVLRKGQTWMERGYRSPQEIAQEQLLQQRKAEKERVKQLQEDAYNLALADWLETLSEEEKLAIAPAKKAGQIAMPQSVKLSLYFKENIWSEKKEKYLIHPK